VGTALLKLAGGTSHAFLDEGIASSLPLWTLFMALSVSLCIAHPVSVEQFCWQNGRWHRCLQNPLLGPRWAKKKKKKEFLMVVFCCSQPVALSESLTR